MLINRIIAALLFIISLIVISLSGGPAAYGFFFFTVFTPLISLIYTFIVYSRFRIYQEIGAKKVTAGNSTPFYFTLQNEDYFSHSGIRVHFFSDFSEIYELGMDTEYELAPRSGIKKETILVCKYRGEYEVGIKSVTITDYLRLFSITFKNKETLKVNVIPRIEMIPDSEHMEESISPSGREKNASMVPDIPVREYIPGDDIRMINWKATAKLGKLLTRTYTGENAKSVSIIMDSFRYSDEPEKYLPLENKILETAIALSRYLTFKGISASVYAYKDKLVKFEFSDSSDFLDSYALISAFSFRPDENAKEMYSKCGENREILTSASHILILHEWSKEAALLSDRLSQNAARPSVFIVTDDPESVGLTSDKENIRIIGYQENLKEALG